MTGQGKPMDPDDFDRFMRIDSEHPYGGEAGAAAFREHQRSEELKRHGVSAALVYHHDARLRVKRLRPTAKLPKQATDGSAGYDLFWDPNPSAMDARMSRVALAFEGQTVNLCTGVAFAIPRGMVGLVYSRSGHGFKHGVRLSNCVGVIDSDYRGEVKVKLIRDDPEVDAPALNFKPGDAIAQIVFVKYETGLIEVDTLDETARGAKGFGSTDKK